MGKKAKIGLLLFCFLIILGFALRGKISGEKFEAEKWKNWQNTEEEWSLRWDMMNSLRNNYELKGMSKREIIKLLGTPDTETKKEFTYYLGYSHTGINTGTLSLYFDQNNRVIDFDVWDG